MITIFDKGEIINLKLKGIRKAHQRKYPPEEQRQYYKNKLNRKFKQSMPNKA